jgi:ABC-type transport system substrate-binding protein
MLPYTAGWTMMYPQLRAPVPPALGDPQLRRAIIMAIDRQQLAETLTAGLATVAHSIIAPDQAEYASIEKDIVRYDYDQRRSAQMIESLGFTRGQDGSFRDGAGQPLSVEVRTTTNDANQKATFAIADYLQRAGLTAEPFVIPVQQLQNREFRATYPGLELVNQPAGANGFRNLLHSSAAPLPERNYRAPASSRNRGQYVNPDYDALMDQYNTTIPARERMQAMGQIIRQQTDQQLLMGIFYTVDAIMMANRLKNVPPASTWNAETWEVSS